MPARVAVGIQAVERYMRVHCRKERVRGEEGGREGGRGEGRELEATALHPLARADEVRDGGAEGRGFAAVLAGNRGVERWSAAPPAPRLGQDR